VKLSKKLKRRLTGTGKYLGIQALFLPLVMVPLAGVVLMVFLSPYTGARYARKHFTEKRERTAASVLLPVLWCTAFVLMLLSILSAYAPMSVSMGLKEALLLSALYGIQMLSAHLGMRA